MRRILFRPAGIALSFSLLILPACSGGLLSKGTPESTRFYQLHVGSESLLAAGNSKAVGKSVTIALSVDSFPEYLTRSQIVIRSSDIKLELAQFHHWAKPLQRNFIRGLGDEFVCSAFHGSNPCLPLEEEQAYRLRGPDGRGPF